MEKRSHFSGYNRSSILCACSSYRSGSDPRSLDNFWLVNENMFINPLRDVLRDVKRFARRSQEVIVLDFSSFPVGFYKHPLVYSDLYQLIRLELGDVAYERNVSLSENCAERTYEDLRQAGRQVLLLFPTEELPHQQKGERAHTLLLRSKSSSPSLLPPQNPPYCARPGNVSAPAS